MEKEQLALYIKMEKEQWTFLYKYGEWALQYKNQERIMNIFVYECRKNNEHFLYEWRKNNEHFYIRRKNNKYFL